MSGPIYAKAAAAHAFDALARLCGWGEPKQSLRLHTAHLPDLAQLERRGEGFAVLTDLSGSVRGQAGLLLPAETADLLLERLLGDAPKGALDEQSRSALCEAGNIAVSAASGALGHLAGGVVLPSVPRLSECFDGALNPELLPGAERRAAHPVYVVEVELGEPGVTAIAAFVWVPAA